jgi:hypothetical protein
MTFYPFNPFCCGVQLCSPPYEPFLIPSVLYAHVGGSGVLQCVSGYTIPMSYNPDTGGPGPYWYGTQTCTCVGLFAPGDGCEPPNVCQTCQLNFGACQENGLPSLFFLYKWCVICPSGSSGYYGSSPLTYTYPPFSCTFSHTGSVEFCSEASPVGSGTVNVLVTEFP